MNYYLKVLRNYAQFSGRARRKEYWMYALFNIIFAPAAIVLDHFLGTVLSVSDVPLFYGYIYLFYVLATMVPGLAVGVRRLHDVGKSGWYLLVAIIPLIGAVWLLVLLCTEGQPGDNRFGPDPKEFSSEEEMQGYNIQS